MELTKKKLPKSQIELEFQIPYEEIFPYLAKASEKFSLPGFRPGKAPFEMVKQKIGEKKLLDEIMPDLIRDKLIEAFSKEQLEVIGEPRAEIVQMEVAKPIKFKTVISILPKVTLNDYKSIKAKKKTIKEDPKETDKVISEIQENTAQEILEDKAIGKGDKASVDIEMYSGKIPLENGSFKKQQILAGKGILPKEFEENLLGMKATDEKEFEAQYPENHFDKQLAGKSIKFKIRINEVYKRNLPEINDEFAQNQGFKTIKELKDYINDMILKDKEKHEEERLEGEILDKLIQISEFEELPDILIESEIEKMLHELEINIGAKGGTFDDYLAHIKKTKEDLKKEFLPQAEKRIKTALAIRDISEKEKIEVDDKEIKEELENILKAYNSEEIKKNINSPSYKNYIKNILMNKKVIEKLKEWGAEKKEKPKT